MHRPAAVEAAPSPEKRGACEALDKVRVQFRQHHAVVATTDEF